MRKWVYNRIILIGKIINIIQHSSKRMKLVNYGAGEELDIIFANTKTQLRGGLMDTIIH